MARDVARRSAVFRLAVLHHPPFSSGPNSQDPPTRPSGPLPAGLSASGVDLVLSGHEHFYERTRPIDGVVYVTTGNGGYDLYPLATVNAFTAAFDNTAYGYTVVEVQGRQLTLRHTATDGRQVDSLLLSSRSPRTTRSRCSRRARPARRRGSARRSGSSGPGSPRRSPCACSGRAQSSAALNGAPLALAEGRREGDGFAVFEVDPGRIAPGRNQLEIETRGAAGRARARRSPRSSFWSGPLLRPVRR